MGKYAHFLYENEGEKWWKTADFYPKTNEKNGGKSPIFGGNNESQSRHIYLKNCGCVDACDKFSQDRNAFHVTQPCSTKS